ncbi:MAG: sugar phosphate isomerase/epimerase [Eubacteriales bacterium]|nr:sugar phosphate isomerase/epimerase [Eubacteriales bacterium]
MAILISTNMCGAGGLGEIMPYLEAYDTLGVELFPLFHKEGFEDDLNACIPHLENRPICFHGPYHLVEHSAPKGSEKYEEAMRLTEKTAKYCKKLNSSHFVFHHNNCVVHDEEKERMIQTSCENYRVIEEMLCRDGIRIVVENAGVKDRKNMLFDMDEFIDLCKKENYAVLVDIGHAHANGWDLRRLIEELKGQIVAYHLHNNDGVHDSHKRLHDGSLDFDRFLDCMMELTPEADLVIEYAQEVSGDEEGIMQDIGELMSRVRTVNG